MSPNFNRANTCSSGAVLFFPFEKGTIPARVSSIMEVALACALSVQC
jgi:hypothetical protein